MKRSSDSAIEQLVLRLRERLGGGAKSGNFFAPAARARLEALHVRHQHRVADAWLALDAVP